MDTKEAGGGMNWETGIDTYTLLCPKQIPNENLLYSTENSTQRCGDLNGKDIQKRGDILFIQLIHFAVQQKLIQHCKATIIFLIVYCIIMICVLSQSCPTLQLHGLQLARLLCPWNFPGTNTGAGCHFLLVMPDYKTPPGKEFFLFAVPSAVRGIALGTQ